MLVFCEDCGERNVIDPDKVRQENNQYRCQICNFLNPYLAPPPPPTITAPPTDSAEQINIDSVETAPKPAEETKSRPNQPLENSFQERRGTKRKIFNLHEEPYNRIFQKIAANNNILGAYIYHFTDGVLAYDIDSEMTDATIHQIGKALSVCNPFGQRILNKTKEIYLVLDDQVAVSKSITLNSVLVLLCNSYPIQPEVSTIFNKAINNLQVFI